MELARNEVKAVSKLEHGLLSSVSIVKQEFRKAIEHAFPGLPEDSYDPIVSSSRFGDYQCNNAMGLFKRLKESGGTSVAGQSSPKEIAVKLKENLSGEMFEDISVSPQGFVTIKFSNIWITERIQELLTQPITCELSEPKSIIVDYSSPNIAKEMHVGHLRSTIHGESLSRLLEFVGHKVERVNHLGDWGTQFGMLIEHMLDAYPNFALEGSECPELSDLNAFYKESKKRFDTDSDFKDRARKMVVKLQSGDPVAENAWKMLVNISLGEFQKIYNRLDTSPLACKGESFYNSMLPRIVDICKDAGIVTESDGALCIFVEPERKEGEVPLMLVKSDGGYGYDSTDMAAVYHRLIECKADRVIYVTDMGQENHFLKLFAAAKQMHWHSPPDTQLDHVGLGLVCGADGKKFKTRDGEVVKLADLLDEAAHRAKTEIETRREEEYATDTPAVPVEVAAQRIGYAAVKYFDLKQYRTGNYKFNYETVLDPRGNTAVYLLYAYARICAIFRKASVHRNDIMPSSLKIDEPEERALCLTLLKFSENIEQVLTDYSVHHLCEYVYEVSTSFTDFYQKCKVVGSPQQHSRLCLCAATLTMMETTFNLLGITPLERI